MDRAQEFLNNVLAHERDDYDPAKAHEYYLRTRELKGRKPADKDDDDSLSDKQKKEKREATRKSNAIKREATKKK